MPDLQTHLAQFATAEPTIHVDLHDDGRWAVEVQGGPDVVPPDFHATEEQALDAAWKLAARLGITLFIHGMDGVLRKRDVYRRAPPCRSRMIH